MNGDFLEVAEYFIIQDEQVRVRRYRYQWMDSSQQVLRKRWDNTKHFRQLPAFPDHVHVGDEGSALPSRAMTVIDLISLMERELQNEV